MGLLRKTFNGVTNKLENAVAANHATDIAKNRTGIISKLASVPGDMVNVATFGAYRATLNTVKKVVPGLKPDYDPFAVKNLNKAANGGVDVSIQDRTNAYVQSKSAQKNIKKNYTNNKKSVIGRVKDAIFDKDSSGSEQTDVEYQ